MNFTHFSLPFSLVNGDFAAATMLITFGAVIGRVTPTQFLFMCVVEMVLYGLNNALLIEIIGVADIGGTYTIHMLGAYYGLVISWILAAKKPKAEQAGWEDNTARYTSDIFAMIGTVFLWMYWPSFNGALAGDEGNARHRCVINTTLSISASAFFTFLVSRFLRHDGKFSMVDVQNATLAGGVAMGCSSNMLTSPWGAMFIGSWAGILSTVGFNKIQPYLAEKFNLHDTCGIHNLHAMPSVWGAFCSVVVTAVHSHADCM